MRRFGTRSRHERGATLVETAIVLPIVLLLAFGLAEIGFGMISQMTAANAAREGARVGAAGGPNPGAELAILRSVEQAMCSLEQGDLVSVEIYRANANGDPVNPGSQLNRYAPTGPLNCTNSATTSLACTNGCPWPPSARNDSVLTLDDLGVRVTYTHRWLLSFVFPGTATWSDKAVMRIEPDTGT